MTKETEVRINACIRTVSDRVSINTELGWQSDATAYTEFANGDDFAGKFKSYMETLQMCPSQNDSMNMPYVCAAEEQRALIVENEEFLDFLRSMAAHAVEKGIVHEVFYMDFLRIEVELRRGDTITYGDLPDSETSFLHELSSEDSYEEDFDDEADEDDDEDEPQQEEETHNCLHYICALNVNRKDADWGAGVTYENVLEFKEHINDEGPHNIEIVHDKVREILLHGVTIKGSSLDDINSVKNYLNEVADEFRDICVYSNCSDLMNTGSIQHDNEDVYIQVTVTSVAEEK